MPMNAGMHTRLSCMAPPLSLAAALDLALIWLWLKNPSVDQHSLLALLVSSLAMYFEGRGGVDRVARVAEKIVSSGISTDSSDKPSARHAGMPPSMTATLRRQDDRCEDS